MMKILPGLGDPVPVRLHETSAAVGKTLAQLNLRGLTGATVLAILRGGEGIIAPTAHERLCAGDVLALAGTHEAVEAAKSLVQETVTSASAPGGPDPLVPSSPSAPDGPRSPA